MPMSRNDIPATLMAKVGACWSPNFSSDGKQIAFVSNLNGIPQVWTISAIGSFPQQVTALDDQVGLVRWSPDGQWLAFSLAPGGGMNQQVYLVRPDGTELRRITPGSKDNNWLGFWTHDSRALAIASNRANPAAMDVYLVDVTSDDWRLVAHNQGIGRLHAIHRDGRYGLLYRQVNRGSSDLFLLDLANGAEVLLTPHEGPGNFDRARFSPDGQTIYLISDKDREQPAFARIMFNSQGKPGAIEVIAERDDAQLEEYALSEDGQTAALVWNAAGRCELVFLDLATRQMTPAPVLPAETVSELAFSQDGSLLALVAAGSTAPKDIWVIDRQASRRVQVTYSPHPGVKLEALVAPELVRFSAHDGLELTGWLYRPSGVSGRAPLVLSFHGGPEGQERPIFSDNYQALLAQGIAVLAPNVRGSSGFGKTFVNLDNGALRFDAIRDIKACVDYAVDAGIADPRCIGIMGGSYGGYMTMAGLTMYPDLFAAGVNIFGVVNFKTFFQQTEPWMAAISKIEYGDPDTQGDLLDSLSPIHQIDKVQAPTLVLHGANDTNVPVIEAEQVVDRLKRRGVPVEYVLFPDEGHGFQKEPNRIKSTASIVAWFVKYLKAD